MHILGKILLGLLFVAAAAGTVLMSRHLQIKNSYTQKLKTLKDANTKTGAEIAQKEEQLQALNGEFERVMYDQRAYWDKRSGIPDAASGSIGVHIGQQDGIGAKVKTQQPPGEVQRRTNLFVFYRPDANAEQTKYIGPFILSGEPGAQDSTLQPDWKLRSDIPSDQPNTWPNGLNTYRVRMAIRTKDTTGFRDLYLKLDTIDAQIAANTADQSRWAKSLKSAEADVRKLRVDIAGNDGASGMLGELSKAQDDRDAVLAAVDQLRRNLRQFVAARDKLIAENGKLKGRLPQPASASGKTP